MRSVNEKTQAESVKVSSALGKIELPFTKTEDLEGSRFGRRSPVEYGSSVKFEMSGNHPRRV